MVSAFNNFNRIKMKNLFSLLVFYFISCQGFSQNYAEISAIVDGVKQIEKDIRISPLTNKESEWLRGQIIPLKGSDPKIKLDDDLLILSKLVGNAKVVALGEVSHGSSEIFKMKHRIIKYLAEKENFDIFSIEACMPESYKVSEYTVEGKGDPKGLIKGMYFWTWRTEEVLGMVEWMRQFNNKTTRITFTGFDMQSFSGAIKELENCFSNDSDKQKVITELKGVLENVQANSTGKRKTVIKWSQSKVISQKLSDIKKFIADSKFEKRKSDWLRQNVRIIEQYLDFGYATRDKFMAENILWIKNQNPDSKIVIWAHNFHISKNQANNMGKYLSDSLKDDYLSIGFAFYKGSYTAIGKKGLSTYPAQEAPPGTYEYYFNSMNEPIFILDLRTIKKEKSEYSKWLLDKANFRATGAVKMGHEFFKTNLTDDFDIIVFIKESTNSTLLK